MTTAIKLGCGLFVLGTLTPFSSAKPLPLEAPDPGRGIIGIRVRVRVNSPARMGSSAVNAVYFVRVTEDPDRFGAESFTTLGSGKRGIAVFSGEAEAHYLRWASRIAGRSGSPVGVAVGSPSSPNQS